MAERTNTPSLDVALADSGTATTESASAATTALASTTSAATTSADSAAPSAEFLLHVAQQINEGFQSSLTKVVADISHEYGFASAPLEQKGDGDAFDATTALQPEPTSDNVHLIIHELQASRRRQHELQQRVDELQSEQTLATERVALYAELAQQLKRELVNERLAHTHTKKEASAQSARALQQQRQQQRQQRQQQRDSGDEKSSVLALTSADNDDDPWSSPSKTTGGSAGAATSNILSFSSFYQSPRLLGGEDEPPSPMSSTGGSGLQPLRSSMMDQFLPSSLLDSPQITPSSRASSKSFSRKDDEDDNGESSSRLAFASEITKDLGEFSLLEAPCPQCKQQPQSECAPCGHQLCANCEASMLAQSERQCPRCRIAVSAVKDLPSAQQLRDADNQREHFVRADVSSDAVTRQSGTGSPMTGGADAPVVAAVETVSPVTLSLMAELFDTIPLEQLEVALKEAAGQAPRAIEKLLESHPSFHPGDGTSRRRSSSASQSQSPVPPGHKTATHRGSASASSQGAATGGGSASSAASNWKTEMCMYYLQGKCNKTRRTCSFAHGESDLVRPSSAKHAAAVGFKTRMCPLFVEGTCPKSRRDCPLAHGESDLREGLVALASSVALPAAAPRLQSYKTELCYYYLKGCCNYTKDECRFAHGESDLRTVESNTLEWTAKLVGAGEFSPVGVSSTSGGASSSISGVDKPQPQLQHQHQYQQQFQPQFAPPPQPQQPPPPSQQLQHTSPAFTPAHQLPLPHHQFAFQQHMPPPHLAMQHGHPHHLPHQQQQQGMYHGSQFRYGMDSGKRSARPPPPPRRDSASWSGGYDSSSSADF